MHHVIMAAACCCWRAPGGASSLTAGDMGKEPNPPESDGNFTGCLSVCEVVAVIVPAVNTARIEALVADRHNFAAAERFDEATADCTGREFALVVVVRHFSFPPITTLTREYIKDGVKAYIVVMQLSLLGGSRGVASLRL